ncbi:protein brown-like isoform X4 [Frieseomelitta varia]|uniref:protein brown-like isoform X4 n=1 Tax=Frieseomelitta varia TaxID=561572 RepID=UPI001CB6AFB2|nr:protein brown-like isoform X4 [Frieseomelitta varia]
MIILEELEHAKGNTIVWDDLTVTVPRKTGNGFLNVALRTIRRRCYEESLVILKGVSGYAVTGNLVAIMGPSGAGKTTLLATLAGKIASTTGMVSINGETVSRTIMSKISSYLPQADALPTSLTVEEFLLFSCAMKMDVSGAQKKFLSTKLSMELGLIDCKEVLISSLSGGQKKRLSLASELIAKPKILFLDEPTTGLDTFSAMQVVQTLRAISAESIIFCTIHQPGMDIYSLFTHVLLLSDGRTGYFGILEDATRFFLSLGYECPVGFDESEYYIKLLSRRNPETSATNPNCEDAGPGELIDKICRAFSRSPLSRIPEITDGRNLEIEPQERKPGCTIQFSWLTWRIWTQNRRTMFHGWIAWISYFIPKAILQAVMFTTVIYLVVVTRIDLFNFLFYCSITSTSAICAIAYGLMFSIWIEDIDFISLIMVPIDMLFLLTAGMFYNLRSLPTCLTCFKYFSIFFYLNEALSIVYWSRVDDIDCQASSDFPCLRNGEQVLSEYGFKKANLIWDFSGLILLTIAMNVLGYFGLQRRRKIRTLL